MNLKKAVTSAVRFLTDEDYRFYVTQRDFGMHKGADDRTFLEHIYKVKFNRPLNLENPRTFNEKMQWLKLYDRRPEYTVMVDKYAAKQYVADKIGPEHIIPTLGVWERAEDIDFDSLPDQFVMKGTHDSHHLIICTDKSKLDIADARRKMKETLENDYYLATREWPYKHVPRKIIAEVYMDEGDGQLADYKIHCFGGEPKLVQIIRDRFHPDGVINDHYTPEWEKLELARGTFGRQGAATPRPPEMDEMLRLARVLSAGIPYLRTDFYIVNHQIYFGELTFFPASGTRPFIPEKWDEILGSWITLPPVTEAD